MNADDFYYEFKQALESMGVGFVSKEKVGVSGSITMTYQDGAKRYEITITTEDRKGGNSK